MQLRDPVIVTADALDDIKSYLRIITDDDDALIASLIATALVRAESFCGQMLVARNVTEVLPAQPLLQGIAAAQALPPYLPYPNNPYRPVANQWQALGALPVQGIGQVNLAPVGATPFPLLPAQFAVDIDAEGRGWVQITDQSLTVRINVIYTAGLASGWDTIPEAIRHGVIRLVSYLYTSRDAAGDGGPPAAVAALLRPWRRMRIAGSFHL